jgi:hypothetical protein
MRKRVDWTDQVWEIYERVTGQQRPPLFAKRNEESE